MKEYNHRKIEKKWRKVWAKRKVYRTSDSSNLKKCYVLDMFPYPSGEGLHVGHPKGYIATDVYSRYKKMQGFNVLHPMGFDAFGLPAENYAIKNKIHPKKSVDENIKYFKEQLENIGFNYDWEREINTTDPKYYKWTQWIFLQMFKKGLAYESFEPINWCPSCKTGLANEDVEDGRCERCGTIVEKKPLRQWVLKITDYAERLLKDVDALNWPTSIKESQKNWIGKSEGAEVRFAIRNTEYEIRVFTTRIDTIFSGTFVILAPEHPLLSDKNFQASISNFPEVERYIVATKNKPEIERVDKENKSGVELKGLKAVNPATDEEISIWVSDFVLPSYGTGAVFADAHDKRDFGMAKKYGIPLKTSIKSEDGDLSQQVESLEVCYEGEGVLYNSKQFDGLHSKEARVKITEWLAEKGLASKTTKYKLRDWVFSRQRYWGEPIPLIHCNNCKTQRALLIHGFEGHGSNHWFPWIKKQLEDRGIEVYAPTLTTSNHPTVESWLNELKPLVKDFGPDDIVIGHSLGSNAALQLVSAVNRNIGHLYLVASAIGRPRNKNHWAELEEKWGSETDIKSLKAFWQEKINYAKTAKLASSITLIRSKDDTLIPKDTHENLPEDFSIEEWDGYGHFSVSELPELVKKISESIVDGVVPVPEKDLPVELPKVKNYEPSGTGESPLANIKSWVNVNCPNCGGKGRRETNTMPQWAGSSWYYLRYMDPKNKKALVGAEKEKYWSPVDLYVGGAEHATRHLIYARFWHKFLKDIGVVSTDEPFKRLQHVGLIMAEDGRKMSKRFGNVINPDDIVETYGADTLRLYEMFMGPFDQSISWNTESMIGPRRFVERIWKLAEKVDKEDSSRLPDEVLLNQTIKKVGEDIESMRFNTAVSQLMIFSNMLEKQERLSRDVFSAYLRLIAPFAPHVAEELWHGIGMEGSIHEAMWPQYDTAKLESEISTIVVQINGKVRGSMEVPKDLSEEEIVGSAKDLPDIKKWIEGKEIRKVIFVPGRLVNIVVV